MNTFIKNVLVAGAFALTLSTIAAVAPAGATANSASCVDGKNRSNLVVTWISNSEVTVGTVNNKPLCNDTDLFFSSYTMPDNYNGKPFNDNPTATPQTIFGNTAVALKKDSVKPVKATIKLPEACKNIQVDVYYAPKIETVSKAGHGSQYISGKIISKTNDACTPDVPVTPVVPTAEAQTPETPKPVVVIPTTPTELPKTGNSIVNTIAVGAFLSVSTYMAVLLASKRQ